MGALCLASCAGPSTAPDPITPAVVHPEAADGSGRGAAPAPILADGAFHPDTPDVHFEASDLDMWFAHIQGPATTHDVWLPDAASGLVAANDQEKPLLLWIEGTHPLKCDCPGELMGSRSVFQDPVVTPFLSEFVLAAESRYTMETGADPTSRLVQRACAHVDGELAGVIGSGVYALSPSGVLLGKVKLLRPAPMEELLSSALEAWFSMDPTDHAIAADAGFPQESLRGTGSRAAQLILSVVGRPLPVSDDPSVPRHTDVVRQELWIDDPVAQEFLTEPGPSAVSFEEALRFLASRALLDPQEPPSERRAFLALDVDARGSVSAGEVDGQTYARDLDGRAVVATVRGRIGRGPDGDLTGRIVAKGYVRKSIRDPWIPAGWAISASPKHRAGYVRPLALR